MHLIPSKKKSADYLTKDIAVKLNGSTANIPAYDGSRQVIEVNGGRVFFDTYNLSPTTYETYSGLDSLGRTGYAEGCFGIETFNKTERGSLGMYKPSGFCQHKYEELKTEENLQGYAMARLHLLMRAFGGNDEADNLISGTFAANDYRGMETYEMHLLDYMAKTGNHVVVRSTPIYGENNLLAYGILYEAKSVEDDTIELNVFIYNADPDLVIDYSTGENWLKS